MVKEIPLTQGYVAIVDDEDYEYLNRSKWHIKKCSNNRIYPLKYDSNLKHVKMHNLILNPPKGFEVDHINCDTLDNRRCNLRICTHSQNIKNSRKQSNNTSGYKGVSWHKGVKKWQSQLCANGKYIVVGYFNDKVEAAKAYDAAAKKYHGEFARVNFPE